MTKEERERILDKRRRAAAQNAANALVHQLDLQIRKVASSEDYDDVFYVALLKFKEEFIQKLLEKKPKDLKCQASNPFFQGLTGIKVLTSYFPSNLSMTFDWETGHAKMTYQ